MASSKLMIEFVGDVTECPICIDVIKDSRVLPCIHTLKQYWKDKQPGSRVPCPICRMEFDIPTGGLVGLPRNFFIEQLLDVQHALSNLNISNVTCAPCFLLKNENDEAIISPAEKCCIDCQQNLCSHCARMHCVTKGLELHRLEIIGKLSETKKSTGCPVKHCDIHHNETIQIYCLECKTAVCQTCFISKHNGHKCSDINEVAKDLKKQIERDMNKTNELLQKVNYQSEKLEEVLNLFLGNSKETEAKIIQRGNYIHHLVGKHVKYVLKQLKIKTRSKMKEMVNANEELLVQRISFESFIRYTQTLLEEASPSDIACLSSQLKTRAEYLNNVRIIGVGEPVKVCFNPTNLELFFGINLSTRNLIGVCSISGNSFGEWFCT